MSTFTLNMNIKKQLKGINQSQTEAALVQRILVLGPQTDIDILEYWNRPHWNFGSCKFADECFVFFIRVVLFV